MSPYLLDLCGLIAVLVVSLVLCWWDHRPEDLGRVSAGWRTWYWRARGSDGEGE